MAGPIKVTLYMKAGIYGASESYIYAATSFNSVAGTVPPGTLSWAGGTPLDELVGVRSQLSTDDVTIEKVRLQDLGTPGKATSRYPVRPVVCKAAPAGDNETDWTSLLITQETANGRRAPKYIFGVPYFLRGPDNQYTLLRAGEFQAKLDRFTKVLTNGNWQIQHRPALGAGDMTPITSFEVAPDGLSAVLGPLIAPTPIPASGKWLVVVRGLRGPKGWNGVHEATAGTGNTTIIGPGVRVRPSAPAFASMAGQTVALFGANFDTINFAGPVRIVERDRGRPFDSPVGRRRVG